MQKSGPEGTVNYLYDNNGNLTQQSITGADGVITCYDYTFNELNQLVKITKNGRLFADYFYDEKGLSYKKVDYMATETKTTIYVYGQGTEPMYEEVCNSTNLTAPVSAVSYLNMGAKRLGRWENGSTKYYFTDHLGSTRIVMDSAGKCTYQDYDLFGGDFGATSSERYKFTGKEDDDAIGLYYYNARYYDPTVGRFISEDPAKDGANWYVYCENNSLKFVDVDGKQIQIHGSKKIRAILQSYLEEATSTHLIIKEVTNGKDVVTLVTGFTPKKAGELSGKAKENVSKFSKIQGYLKEMIDSQMVIGIKQGSTTAGGYYDATSQAAILSVNNTTPFYYFRYGKSWKNLWTGEVWRVTWKEVMMHELLGHGLDQVRGIVNSQNETDDKIKKLSQRNAIDRENEMAVLFGIPIRPYDE